MRTAAIAVTLACATILSVAQATSNASPGPLPEGKAGPPARLPDGLVAKPPRLVSPIESTGCQPAGYGPHYYAPGTAKRVALTFDDGPGKSTRRILRILGRFHVAATFFNLGVNAAAHPRLLKAELNRGYVLGNHTWDHADLEQLSAARQAAEMDRMSTEQHDITGTWPCLFRPPYGAYDKTTLRLAQRRRLRVWLWSVDTEDWKAAGSGSDYWIRRIIRLAETEGIRLSHPVILMHNQPAGNPATVRALPTIIRYFKHHHYRFVKL